MKEGKLLGWAFISTERAERVNSHCERNEGFSAYFISFLRSVWGEEVKAVKKGEGEATVCFSFFCKRGVQSQFFFGDRNLAREKRGRNKVSF